VARNPLFLLSGFAVLALLVAVVLIVVGRSSSSSSSSTSSSSASTVAADATLTIPTTIAGEAHQPNPGFDSAVQPALQGLRGVGAHSVIAAAYGPTADAPDELLFAATGSFGGGANAASFAQGFAQSVGGGTTLGTAQTLTRGGRSFSCRTISGQVTGVTCVWDEDHYFGAVVQLRNGDVGHAADFAAAARMAALGH